jgi:hypothetical protein
MQRAIHAAEMDDISERKLRLRALELAVTAEPTNAVKAAASYLNFLLGLDGASSVPLGLPQDNRNIVRPQTPQVKSVHSGEAQEYGGDLS